MEEREEGMTFGEVLSLMFKNKLLLLIITAAVTVVGILGIFLVYNPMKKTSYTEFKYQKSSLATGTYENGEVFRINDLISLENIQKVIDSDEKYKSLDAEKIYKEATLDYVVPDDTDSETKSTEHYKLSILSKRLKNDDIAEDFIDDLLNLPFTENATIIKNYDYKQKITAFNNSNTYTELFDNINAIISSVTSSYQSLSSNYGDTAYKTTKDTDAILLSQRVLDLQTFVNNSNIGTLSSSASVYGLVYNYDYSRSSLVNSLNSLNRELKKVNSEIAENDEEKTKAVAEIGSSQALSYDALKAIYDKSVELNTQKVNIEAQIELVELQLENETATYVYYKDKGVISESDYNELSDSEKIGYVEINIADYKNLISTTLASLITYLDVEIDKVQELKLYYNSNYNNIYYLTNQHVQTEGTLNIILSILLPILVGLVIGWIVNFAMSYKDFKKKKEEELEQKEKEYIEKQIRYKKMMNETDSEK